MNIKATAFTVSEKSINILINRIPGECILISSLPGSALITHVESLCKPRDVNKHSQNFAW